jgi:AcrR family transcriptional regulator
MVTDMSTERLSERRQARGEATRRELVDAATRLFAREGYEQTSIESVLRETGVSRGALYHHFASKEALFEAVLDELQAACGQTIIASVAGIDDPAEMLREGSLAFLRLAGDPVVRRISLIDAPAALGWERWREIDERHGFGMMKGAVSALAAAGRIDAELVDTVAHMLLAALVEVAMLIARADDPKEAAGRGEAAIDDLLESFLRS